MKNEDSKNFGFILLLLAIASIVGVWSAGGCTNSKTGRTVVELHVDRVENDIVTLSHADTTDGIVYTYVFTTDMDYIQSYDVSAGTAEVQRRFLTRVSRDKKLLLQ